MNPPAHLGEVEVLEVEPVNHREGEDVGQLGEQAGGGGRGGMVQMIEFNEIYITFEELVKSRKSSKTCKNVGLNFT